MSQKRQPEDEEESMGKAGCSAESGGSNTPQPHHPHHGEPKRQKTPALRGVITEVMWNSSINKFLLAIEPLIRRVVKEEVELAFENHFTRMTRGGGNDVVPSISHSLQLQFMTKLSLPIFTGSKIEGESSSAITIALVDGFTRQVVTSGEVSLMKVEIVVLEGDFVGAEEDNWTAQEFNSYIVREREGKQLLLTGDVFVDLNEGIGTVGELSFTDNSSWTRSRKFRLGARTEDGCFNGVRVKEAKTESFMVKDHRGELYKKHHPPSLEDEVWRLEKIGKDGAFHKRLNNENIITVKDLLTLLHVDAARLRNILGSGMSTKMWEATVEHAKTCILTDEVHVYYDDGPSKTGVVFNAVGEVKGIISEQQFVSINDLVDKDKAEAHAAVKLAYEHWNDVFTCDTQTLLAKPSPSFHSSSPAVRGNEYSQFRSQVDTEGFDLSHSNIQSPDIFSFDVSRTLDACALQAVENMEDQFHPEMHTLGGQGLSEESRALGKFSNSLLYDECGNQPSYSDDCLHGYTGPSISFDTSDLGVAWRGFISTMKPHGRAYRGWRTLSYVLGLIFYTKKVVALKRMKRGK